ncbi:glycosyl hydrolase 53 family protein [Arthrobacter sp. PAMC25284]|uniref:glycoside hydrolase family 53 protein n=1 Tax=Arthrobacter sp. PAMC25284 TaxID=2861279 RepID=UPI001C62E909|nr:glycosyl hydrolase 53 family protein [Arthrobacter sp. PAMC25284]QYF89079.1 arabinogalactan endo-1,4-beta-galactosidase [Arthrobacter sp. PAMC25284]
MIRAAVLAGATGAAWVSKDQPGTTSRSAAPVSGFRFRGADISFTLQEEAIGTAVRDAAGVRPIERLLARRGANTVRLRVWVDPLPGTSGLAETLVMARRAHDAGLGIILSLHYSDTWADGKSQPIPKAWRGLDDAALLRTVENYTRKVVGALVKQGTPAHVVQIGNEISRGMLWPAGQVYRSDGEHWSLFAKLLKAGVKGAKTASPDHPPLIMIHTETGGDKDASKYFFDRLVARRVPFDIIGLTYYPFWNGPLTNLETTLHQLVARYGRDVMVAETAYPWTLAQAGEQQNVVRRAEDLPEAGLYPPTPAGQAAYFERLRRVLQQVPGGRCAGFLVWEPGWTPGVRATPEMGNAHANLGLFDWTGQGHPALKVFRA